MPALRAHEIGLFVLSCNLCARLCITATIAAPLPSLSFSHVHGLGTTLVTIYLNAILLIFENYFANI